jgi:MFS family permease
LNGLAAGMITPIAMAYAGEVAQEGKEGRAMGTFNRRSNRYNTTKSLGVIVAPLISGVMMDYSGINSVFYFAGILSLVFTFIGCYYVWRWSKGQ